MYQVSTAGDVLFSSPDYSGVLLLSKPVQASHPLIGEDVPVAYLSRLRRRKVKVFDLIVDFGRRPFHVEHGPLFRRVAAPDILDGLYDDGITLISHRTN